MDPVATVHPDRDSTFALMLEAQRRGHRVLFGEPTDLLVDHNRPKIRLFKASMARRDPPIELSEPSDVYLDEVDAVFMRKDPPFDMGYVFSTYMLDLLNGRTLVINDPVGIKKANEKMYALMFPSLIPETIVTSDVDALKSFMDEMGGEMIVKPWDGNGGRGVLYVSRGDRNLNSLLELSTGDGTRYVLGQRYVPEVTTGDKRILLVDGVPKGAILRVPAKGELRGNIHVGARVVKASLTERDHEICRTIGPSLRRDGLLFVGIDVIGDWLTEINVTSPTGIQELDAFDGICVEGDILDRVESLVERGVKRLGSWTHEE